MANGTLYIHNGSSLTLYYGIWRNKSCYKSEPIYAGGTVSYDDSADLKFNVAFYFQTVSTCDYNQALVGQAMDVPTSDGTGGKKKRVTVTQADGGFRIIVADADAKVADSLEQSGAIPDAALPPQQQIVLR